MVDKHLTNYLVWNRQTGKTTFAGIKGAQFFLRDHGVEQNFLAPRKAQLKMFRAVRKVLNHPHIQENYLKGGANSATLVESPNLGSRAEAMVLGDESQFRRGSSGVVWADEAELVAEEAKREVIEPLQANPDARVTLIYTMTPKLSFDPHLGDEIAAAIADPKVGYQHTHMFQSALEMRTRRDYIVERFGDGPKGFKIPCPYGRQGHCPAYYRELYESDPVFWKQFKRWEDFTCTEVCKRHIKLLQEDWAEFPREGGRYFELEHIEAAAEPYQFKHWSEINPNARHVVSADWGLTSDPMDVQVWEQMRNDVRLIFWLRSMKGAHLEDEQLDLLKKIFTQYKGDILMVDVTEDNTFLQRNITRPHTKNERYRIPAGKIWANETAKKNDFLGIVVKGPFKSSMYAVWRSLLMNNVPVVPDRSHEPEFWDHWFEDHFTIEALPAHDGQYHKFGTTGHTVDAAAMAGLAISGAGVRKIHVGIM
jgi:hypothetical protein